ncbi:hypothetical protein [Halomicrobium salinisoli]|uniref:hypothetical protein n=1 Tax=Halomicrobium salinisoli TaxID=2878391 RepID=UPI001CF0AC6E|nr:hypothetical protein [Halomicrobium salinisoli]
MSDSPSRRAFLATATTAVVGSQAGCLWLNEESADGHLFVENTSTDVSVIGLTVTPGTDQEGDPVVSGWYRLPVDTGFRYDEVLQSGTAYTLTVRRTDVEPQDRVNITVPTCESGNTGRTVSVRAQADGLGVIPWGCEDSDYTLRELDYGQPDEYAVDPPAGADSPAGTESPTDAATTDGE